MALIKCPDCGNEVSDKAESYKTMRSQPNLTNNSKICKLRLVDRWSLLFYD